MSVAGQQNGSGGGNEGMENEASKLNKEIRAMNREEFSKWYDAFLTSIVGNSITKGLKAWYDSLEVETHNHLKQIVPLLHKHIEELVEIFVVSPITKDVEDF